LYAITAPFRAQKKILARKICWFHQCRLHFAFLEILLGQSIPFSAFLFNFSFFALKIQICEIKKRSKETFCNEITFI